MLRVDGSPDMRSYLRFDVRNLTAPVTRATLRVWAEQRRKRRLAGVRREQQHLDGDGSYLQQRAGGGRRCWMVRTGCRQQLDGD